MRLLTTHIKASRTFPVITAIFAALLLITVFGGSSAKAYPSGAHLYSDTWAGQPSGLLSSPYDAAVDEARDLVYVLDTGNNRVQVFNTDGVYQFQFGAYGSGDGQFVAARGIDYHNGRVFVADSGNNRIQVFTREGQFLYKFGSLGSGATQFRSPIGVAATNGIIYVADTNNHRISVWAENCGTNCASNLGAVGGTAGSADGQFSQPFGVDITYEVSQGVCAGESYAVMYVADYGNSRVQKFTANPCFLPDLANTYERKWSIGGQPYKAKVGPNGNIYTIASVGTPVTVNTPTGTLVTTWGSAGTGDGQFRFARGVGVSSTQVFVTDGDGNRVQRFSPTGTFQMKWGVASSGAGEFNGLTDVSVDSAGNIYVADTNNSRIQKFNSSGRFLMQWGTQGSGDGQFNNPLGVGVDANDVVWVADTGNNRVQKFNTSGVFQSKFGSAGTGNGQFNGPRDIAFIGTSVYIVDGGNNRVQAFNNADNAYITKWGSSGSGNGQFSFINSIASGGGWLYVSDNNRIQGFNFGGGHVQSISVPGGPTGLSYNGSELLVAKSDTGEIANYLANSGSLSAPYVACTTGDGNGELSNPQGIHVYNGSTNVLVADRGNNRLSKLLISGLHIGVDPTSCGSTGQLGNSQFSGPRGVAAAPNGDIVVADTFNNRVSRYSSSGQAIQRWGLQGGPDGFQGGATAVAVAPDGTTVVADSTTLRRFNAAGTLLNSVSTTGSTQDLAVSSTGEIYRLIQTQVTRYNPATLAVNGTFGTSGSGNGQLNQASGLGIDSTNAVYVADYGNNRVQKFTSTGTYQSQFPSTRVRDVAFSPDDQRLYTLNITTSPAGEINTYTPAGSPIEKFGSGGSGVGQFVSPLSLAVTSTGRVAVADTGNDRVQMFDFTNSRTLYDSKITDYGGNELTVPAIPTTTVTGGF